MSLKQQFLLLLRIWLLQMQKSKVEKEGHKMEKENVLFWE
jgi:hypothetical protein